MHHLAVGTFAQVAVELGEGVGVDLESVHHRALALGLGIGRCQQQVESSVELVAIAELPFNRGARQHLTGLDDLAVGPQVGEGQNLLLAPQHVGGRDNAHNPAAALGEHLLQFGHIDFWNQQDLAIGRLPRQDPTEGIEVGLLQQGIHHRFGLLRPLHGHLGAGEALAAADHHIAPAEGNQVGLEIFEFPGAGGNASAHLGQFRFVAANVGIAGLHIPAEAIALRLELAPLGE